MSKKMIHTQQKKKYKHPRYNRCYLSVYQNLIFIRLGYSWYGINGEWILRKNNKIIKRFDNENELLHYAVCLIK